MIRRWFSWYPVDTARTELHVFSRGVTDACKGLALILLLWHHLFYDAPDVGPFVHVTAQLSKVCVAIFLILSGYGLSVSTRTGTAGLLSFLKKRLAPIYLGYWFVALVFVPIGVFLMNRSLQDAFTNHAYVKFAIQMTGFHRFAYDEYGYNPTWWYMSVILPLIIFFPLLYRLTERWGLFFLFLCLCLLLPAKDIIPVINPWIMPFVVGIYLSQKDSIAAASRFLGRLGWWRFPILATALVLVAAFRLFSPILYGIQIDWLFGVLIILSVFEVVALSGVLSILLQFLGRHLFNIFLFHTFIYLYYWKSFIYYLGNPVLVLLVLLIVCLIVSLILEQLKKMIGFYRILERIDLLPIPSSLEITFQHKTSADVRTSPR